MRQLQEEFKKLGSLYIQIAANDKGYIYAVWNSKYNQTDKPSYYEAFLYKTAKESITPRGTVTPERVRYPNNEDFGSWSWCCGTLESLRFILNEKMPFFVDTP